MNTSRPSPKSCDLADWHTYQVLTKRSERMRDMLGSALRMSPPSPHIWWGVSVEDRRYGLPRIEHLRQAPAAVRFLSVEPLLEDLGRLDLSGIDWVIVGGESGHGARPMDADWVRSIRDQCREARIPFFFKQWGGQKKVNGRELDGRTYDEIPEHLRTSRTGSDRASRTDCRSTILLSKRRAIDVLRILAGETNRCLRSAVRPSASLTSTTPKSA